MSSPGGFKPYAAYRDSAIPWLGKVPEHWEEFPLRRIADIDNSGSYGDEPGNNEQDFPVATTAQITEDSRFLVNRMPRRSFSSTEVRRYACRPDDILVVKSSGSIFNVVTGKAGIVDARTPKFVFSNFLMRVVPNSRAVIPYFLFYLLTSHLTRERVRCMVSGTTYPNLRMDEYTSALMPVPPLGEQENIVHYLTHVDQQIRQYIRAKQKLIKLLEEQKQAIIQQAVTKGLDPKVRLKPSGVEWLGDVPEHWQVRPAKHFYREVDDRSSTGEEELLSVSHITGVTPRNQKAVTMFKAASYVGHKLCSPGDLVINTMWAWMAALGVARQAGIVSPSYAVYRPLDRSCILDDYADLLLRTRPYVSEYICRSTGIRSSRLRLYPEQFLRIRIAVPPPDEQRAILEMFGEKLANQERAIHNIKSDIDLLAEYRSSLVSDVVTGKLDVRHIAASQLSEEVADEFLDDQEAEDVANDAYDEEESMEADE